MSKPRTTNLALCLIVICAASATAQTAGLKVGATSSTIEPDFENERVVEPTVGVFVRVGGNSLALQAELLLVTKGSAFEDADPDLGSVAGSLRMQYLEFPVLAVASWRSVYVFGGPSVAFETQCTAQGSFDGQETESDCNDEDARFAREKLDLGLAVGGGLRLPVNRVQVFVEARYTHGLRNFDADPSGAFEARHRSFATLIGFAVGGK